jgi:hypothetical protein
LLPALQPDAADRRPVRERDEKSSARGDHVLGVGIARARNLKPAGKTLLEFGIVLLETTTRRGVARVDFDDP